MDLLQRFIRVLVSGILGFLVTHFGLQVSPELEASVTVLVSALVNAGIGYLAKQRGMQWLELLLGGKPPTYGDKK